MSGRFLPAGEDLASQIENSDLGLSWPKVTA
jgi:hypothetical protein